MARKTNPYYRGPVSDHFDGTRFFVTGYQPANRTSDFLKWQFGERGAVWPKRLENPPAPAPRQRVAHGDELIVTAIGHATVLIQTAGLNILTDPFFSRRASPLRFAGPSRTRAPAIALDDLPAIDVVLVTHNHYDHMDLPALRALHDGHAPQIITPLGNGAIIARARRPFRVTEADWGDAVQLSKDVTVHLTPARHWSKRGLRDRNMALWCAFVIAAPGGPIYFAGDTGFGDGVHFAAIREQFGQPRLAMLPIGAYEPRWFMKAQHMNPEEAVRAHLALEARYSLAIHYGTIQLTNEAIDDPLKALRASCAAHRLGGDIFRVSSPGEPWRIPPLETHGDQDHASNDRLGAHVLRQT